MNTVALTYATPSKNMSKKAGRPTRQTPLRIWIEARQINREEFAKSVGISERTLQDYMGGTKPSLTHARRIKEASGGELDLDALLDFEVKAA
jgi:hypothetical protein